MLRFFVSLILVLCFSSCGSTRESGPAGQPPGAAVKSRLRGPVALVLMGLQDQLALQRPTQHAAVWKSSGDDAIEGFKGMGGMGEAAVLFLPFMALNALMPPVRVLASGATVSAKKSEEAARKMNARAAQRNWGETVQRSIVREWAARGSGFSSVRVYRPDSLYAGPWPLSRGGLAQVSGPVLLFIHVAGPALAAEGAKLNPRIGPSLLLHWQVVETRSGRVLARGTAAERSPMRKTLLEWARHDEAGMVPELERVIRAAAAKLAAELR